jgi:hypothetical protein
MVNLELSFEHSVAAEYLICWGEFENGTPSDDVDLLL